jgi:diguanylate cyclase (GGDEF)-like protein
MATTNRVGVAEKNVQMAAIRDEQATRRDLAAAARDRAADLRDVEFTRLEGSLRGTDSFERLQAEAKRHRAQAAVDRASAADDRRLAARDRQRASRERAEALEALRCAHFDDLTGAHRRGFGEEILRAEIERARRMDGRLALAFVDVDGLKEVNDTQGHLAGDRLLCEVVEAIKQNIRSYEPVIRIGGDEFAFAMSGFDADGMRERCTVIKADLARRPSCTGITIGIAELRRGDELADLFLRADAALVRARARVPVIRDVLREQPAPDPI